MSVASLPLYTYVKHKKTLKIPVVPPVLILNLYNTIPTFNDPTVLIGNVHSVESDLDLQVKKGNIHLIYGDNVYCMKHDVGQGCSS